MPGGGQNGFWMKLRADNGQCFMGKGHELLVVLCPCCGAERSVGDKVCDKGVIAGGGERVFKTLKQGVAIMFDLG